MTSYKQQQGFALLIFVVVLIGAISLTLSVSLNKSIKQQAQEARESNIKKLLRAKEALLSFSVEYARENEFKLLGHLPCPDMSGGTGNNGSSDANCGTKGENEIGYLPYKSIGLGKILDESNECLWYVVSGTYKNSNNPYLLTNWDTNGLLNVVDENGNLLHGSSAVDKPIALIISPGKSLSQDRAPDSDLEDCQSNYTVSNYLEGGPNIDYTTDLPETALAEWTFLNSSFKSDIEDVDYNDQIVAIYRDEYWDRVKEVKNDLIAQKGDVTQTSAIKTLTQNLAECLKTYMTEDGSSFWNGVYPATVYPSDYTDSDDYIKSDSFDTSTGKDKLYGLFPENIRSSVDKDGGALVTAENFVTSYCVDKQGLNVDLWQNWKSQIFLVTAMDFEPGSTKLFSDKCNSHTECLTSNRSSNMAAIVLFAKEATDNQDRVVTNMSSDFNYWKVYLDGDNNRLYRRSNGSNDFLTSSNDYTMCIEKVSNELVVAEC